MGAAEGVMDETARAARGPGMGRVARLGLVAKGALYMLVGVVAARVALGYGGKPEDRAGALRTIAQDPLGRALVIALAAGLGGYALWRLAQAFFDREGVGDGARGLAKRGSYLARAGWYVVLCGLSVSVLVGRGESRGGGDEREATAGVLDMPFGRWIVGAVGLGVLAAGLFNVFRAVSGKYRKDMKFREMNDAETGAFHLVGAFGHVARGVVFTLIGIFVTRAAYEFDSREAIGLDGALQKLAQQWHGRLWLGVAAAGLVAYGAFCFIQARHRDV